MKYPAIRLVFDRKKTASKKTEGLVQIEVKFDKKNKYLSTGIKLYSDQWKNGQATNRLDYIEMNNQMENQIKNIRSFVNSLIDNNEPFSFDKLDEFLNQREKSDLFIDFIRERMDAKYEKENTIKSHNGLINALDNFGKIKYFSDLTPSNIKLFDDYTRKRVNTQSSIYNYHKRLKVYVREAFFMGLIKKNPYDGFKLSKGEQGISIKYLEPDELKQLEKTEIYDESTSNAKDCFLFGCYTGLSYADLKKFNWETDVITRNGKYFIEDVRQKTGTSYKIQILTKAYAILEKHNFVLPITCNVTYNKSLKVVSSCAKLGKPLTSHMARHTFAVFALNNGVRIEVVSKMLAHTDIKTTQIYAKILQKEVESGFDLLEEKLKGE